MIVVFLTGLFLSFFGSMIPTGPIAVIVLQYGMRGRKLNGLFVASGAAIAEAGYALLAYLGINFVLVALPYGNIYTPLDLQRSFDRIRCIVDCPPPCS